MTFEEAKGVLAPLAKQFIWTDNWAEDDGDDLILSNAGEWRFEEIDAVSKALGTDAIDVNGGGCESCGYGATITVRGILAAELAQAEGM